MHPTYIHEGNKMLKAVVSKVNQECLGFEQAIFSKYSSINSKMFKEMIADDKECQEYLAKLEYLQNKAQNMVESKRIIDELTELEAKKNAVRMEILQVPLVVDNNFNDAVDSLNEVIAMEKDLSRLQEKYQAALGLVITRTKDEIIFRFNQISVHEQCEYTVTLGVNAGNLELRHCSPPITNCSELVEMLRKTNDLGVFLKAIRREFTRLYN